MCGIAGFFNTDGRVASEVLVERMLDAIQYRGPDDRGTWVQGPLALGHLRLSIIDLSERGHQPFVTADGLGVISYNGEVYNFRELRQELEKDGVRFRSSTDTEVVLYALHQWGVEKAVGRFNGMFAFAYYDLRDKTLWLGRDKIGIKPLYVAKSNGVLGFASEIKALLKHPAFPAKPDMHALTTQMLYGRLTGNWSPFERVEVVVPGTVQKVTTDARSTLTYFDALRDIEPARIVENQKKKFESFVENFEKLFAESVSAHLISDAPLAVMCSGGLDSSLITAFAKDEKPDIIAYVADVEGLNGSETSRAETVCRHLGVELRKIPVTKELFLRSWPQMVYHNDEPNFFSQNSVSLIICDTVKRDGFKVLLTGEGSDELFGGYNWQADVYRLWRVRRFQKQWLPKLGFLQTFGRMLSKVAPPDFDSLMKDPFADVRTRWAGQKPKGQICGVDGAQRVSRQAALFKRLEDVKSLEERAFLACCLEDLYAHLRISLSSHEKMAMAKSIEARVPFLSNEMVDFGMHLPCSTKYYKGVGKRIVKKLAERRLPREIVYATKIGFGMTDLFWADNWELLKGGMVSELFKWSTNESKRIFEHILSDRFLLFTLMSLELWLRIYCGGESMEDLSEKLLAISSEKKASIAERSAGEVAV
ncbi:MAG: asparagine synthase (glutamine-hydrolyzing) [Candidatus Omnitrophica bacterium]|nr:asparagine synthase (glutamine-hydrolyzing) [Candidatus Omnitrophota bacterium]